MQLRLNGIIIKLIDGSEITIKSAVTDMESVLEMLRRDRGKAHSINLGELKISSLRKESNEETNI